MEDSKILVIEEKLQKLLKQHAAYQKENEKLQKENIQLTEQLVQKTTKTKQLQEKIDVSNVNIENMGVEAKKNLEKRIETYLKEIDKCLALLHT